MGDPAYQIGKKMIDTVWYLNVIAFLLVQPPTGGSKGTTANHIGFSVPNLRPVVDKIKANGFRMVTSTEAPAGRAIKDDIAASPQPGGASIAFAMGPDDVKVELVEARNQTAP